MKEKIVEYLKKLKKTGFYAVFSSSMINKIVNFAYGIILIRVVSKSEYGIYSYANNIYSYFNLFMGFGVASSLLQVCTEDGEDYSKKYFHFSFGYSYGFVINVVLSLMIVLGAFFVDWPIEGTRKLLLFMSGLPIVTQYSVLFMYWLRSNYQNTEYSILNSINTLLISLCCVLGALIGSTVGLIIGRYVAALITIIISILKLKCRFPKFSLFSDELDKKDKRRIIKIGASLCVSEAVAQIISLIGISVLGESIANEEVIASYKTATTIPTALTFVAQAIMIYAYPYFVKNKDNLSWTQKKYVVLMGSIAIISTFILIFSVLLAEPIITIVFGKQYLDSVKPFRILMVGYFFNSVFRIPASNLLVTQLKLKFTMLISVIASIMSLVLNYIFVPLLNSVGAAWAQTGTMFLAGGICTMYYLFTIRKQK